MKKFIAILLILSLFGFAGCNGNEANKDSEVDKTVTIGVMPDVESIPFLIAEKNGYFEKQGVKVSIEHFTSAKDRDSALQSGKLDGVITDMVAVVFANEGGINLRMISRNEGDIKLLAGKDSGITSIADLKGRELGLSTNTIMEYTADKLIEHGGVNPDEVSKVTIPPLPTRLEMLQGGKVDAVILPDPLAALAVKNGAVVLNSTDRMQNKAGAIAFTAESIAENPEGIKAVFRAYNDAVDYLQAEPANTYIDFIIEEQGFPADVKESFVLPEYQKAELPDNKIFNDVVKWMQNKNLIKGNYEYQDLIDATILR